MATNNRDDRNVERIRRARAERRRKRKRRKIIRMCVIIGAMAAMIALVIVGIDLGVKSSKSKNSSNSKSASKKVSGKNLVTQSFELTKEDVQNSTIREGVKIGDIDVSGMTVAEATAAVQNYVNSYTSAVFTLDVDGNKVETTAGELGYYWKNDDVVYNTLGCVENGNVIERYKEIKDVNNGKNQFEIDLGVDEAVMANDINTKCAAYNIPHQNASLTRENGEFTITPESAGRIIDMDDSISKLHAFMNDQWDGKNASFTLTVIDDLPTVTTADCEKVHDVLGSFSTTFSTGSANASRNANMANGMRLLNGITLDPGETFSANEHLEPWTADNGWENAGTYVNGKVEDSLGGGICQVSSTLYNAALHAELEIVERSNHSLTVGYVPLSQDAALAGTWKDLKILNNTDTPIYIEGIYTGGRLTFNIYGQETRPANRTVEFVSETLATIPAGEKVTEDPTKPAGYRATASSGHIGYKARLMKRVYVDGVLESETQVNSSIYAASDAEIVVGTGTAQTPAPAEETTAEAQTTTAAAAPTTAKPTEAPTTQAPTTQTPTTQAPTTTAAPETTEAPVEEQTTVAGE